MRKVLSIFLFFLATIAANAQSPSGYTYTYGNHVEDASGNLLASGTITFTPTDSKGTPISVRPSGGGTIILRPVQATVAGGQFHLSLADTSLTSPAYFCYAVTVTDNTTGNQVLGGSDFSCIQPYGATYSLDNYSFSTTPILPPTNSTYTGNLSLDGNLSLTGNLYGNIGTLVTEAANITGALAAESTNGELNPTFFPGTDLGAQVNAAFASCTASVSVNGYTKYPSCVVRVPPGIYTVTTQLELEGFASSPVLIMDGAFLNFSGTGIYYGIGTGVGIDHAMVHGGFLSFYNAPNARGGIAMQAGTQGVHVEEVRIEGVQNGDGIVNFGANACVIADNSISHSLIGLHLLGSPGYATNNCQVVHNIINNNARENIIDGDITQYYANWPTGHNTDTWGTSGVSSPNLNNLILGNDLESGGTSNTATVFYPAVMLALTVGETLKGNYYEGTHYQEISVGDTTPPTDSIYQTNYGKTANGGTAVGTSIQNEYFTPTATTLTSTVNGTLTSGSTTATLASGTGVAVGYSVSGSGIPSGSTVAVISGTTATLSSAATVSGTVALTITHIVGDEIALPAAISTTIRDNTELSAPSNCFIDLTLAALKVDIGNNQVYDNNYVCQGGAPVSRQYFSGLTGANHSALNFAIDGTDLYFNNTQNPSGANDNASGQQGGVGIRFDMNGPPTPNNPQNAVTSNPFCNPAWGNGFLWAETTTGSLWICQADTVALGGGGGGNASDGNSTWEKVYLGAPVTAATTSPTGSCTGARLNVNASGIQACKNGTWTAY